MVGHYKMIKHPSTQSLLEYWNHLRAERNIPRRDEIEPRDIKRLLPSVFMLGYEGPEHFRFRLAGTHLCSIFGIELRNFNILDLWEEDCRGAVAAALARVVGESQPMFINFSAETPNGRSCSFEMLLLPLATEDGRAARVLGHVAALSHPSWLGDELLTRQWIERVRVISLNRETKIAVAQARHALIAGQPRLRLVATDNSDLPAALRSTH
jgi:hypothetical protein